MSNKQKLHEKIERREFLKTAAVAAAAGVATMVPRSSTAAEPASPKKQSGRSKVIDFRCRPPLKAFWGLYQMRLGYIAQRPTYLGNPATHGKIPEAVKNYQAANAMELWWKEIDQAGIDAVVVAGRFMAGQVESMDYRALLEYERKYPGRFYGIAPVNLDIPVQKAAEELEAALKSGIRGATIEVGYRVVGGPTTYDDIALFPLYEIIQDSGKILQIQTGAFADPNNWDKPNQIWRLDSVMKQFPKLRLVVGHGGYPRITEMLALALKWPTVTISSDVYTFWPGGQLYQQNIEMLQDQFVYGSAYPFGNFDTTLEQTRALPLSDQAMEKYLYLNAKNLMGI
jgi:predicted TIM-barrel fold metal-dependent hydrolase